jgi:peptidoglycan/LPS O-acetylase OafA/YrhL
MNPNNRSFGLDFMRALAICLVLIAHFAKSIDAFGFWGVEIFFGLSGFLIGQILWRNFAANEQWTLPHVLNFWSRRWWRTLPNYYLFFIVSLIFSYFYHNGLPPIGILLKYLWFGQNLLARSAEFYGVSWSLCVEEWLYLLFPLLLYVYGRFINSKSVSFILTLITFFIGCGLLRHFMATTAQSQTIRILTLTRIDAIACGIATSYFFIIKNTSMAIKRFVFVTGLILAFVPLIIVSAFQVSLDSLQQDQYILIIVPLGASLTLPLISVWQQPKCISGAVSKIIQNLSLWSYSIYLCHIPVLFTVYYLMEPVRSNFLMNLLSKFVGLGITLVISSLLFKYFEMPLTLKRPKEIKTL